MEYLKDPYSDLYYSFYTYMIFLKTSDLLFFILFADDTSVFIEGTAYSSIIKDMNIELVKVDKWLKSNKLTVNIKKPHYMMFHRTRIKKQWS